MATTTMIFVLLVPQVEARRAEQAVERRMRQEAQQQVGDLAVAGGVTCGDR